jgi:hypothetical protein
VWHDFVFDASKVDFHVVHEQLHMLLSSTYKSLCPFVTVIITKDEVCTLLRVIIFIENKLCILAQVINTKQCE